MKRLITAAIISAAMTFCGLGVAGDMTPPAGPEDVGSAMFTLDDVYNRLNDGTPGAKRSGAFTEPDGVPADMGHTLDEVMEKAPAMDDVSGAVSADVESGKTFWGLTNGTWGLQTGTGGGGSSTYEAGVEKTGQTLCYNASGIVIDCANTGQDGDHQAGVVWPNPRFTNNNDGTITDNLTGLIWLRNANCGGSMNWSEALAFANTLESDSCGLTDDSSSGDWRLPNKNELNSLIHIGYYNPALSNTAGTGQWVEGDPFSGVESNYYWSSSTRVSSPSLAWLVYLNNSYVPGGNKTLNYNVWPVRGGH